MAILMAAGVICPPALATLAHRFVKVLALLGGLTLALNVSAAQELPAEQSAPSQVEKPALVVWARTDLAGEGKPTLDLLDLERYFVKQLVEGGAENVAPSATTPIASPPPENIYLVELSVEAMQPATRPESNRDGRSWDEYFFHVELSACVKHVASGVLRGKVIERYEHRFRGLDDSEEMTSKRVAIYATADRLAETLVDAAMSGELGSDLTRIREPGILSRIRISPMEALIAAVFCLILGGVASVVQTWSVPAAPQATPPQAPQNQSEPAEVEPPNCLYEKRLEDAFKKALETDDFSEGWCRAAAKGRCDEILNGAPKIREREAKRLIRWQATDEEYQRIGAYAWLRHGLDAHKVIKLLKEYDTLDYRLFQEAMRAKEEGR